MLLFWGHDRRIRRTFKYPKWKKLPLLLHSLQVCPQWRKSVAFWDLAEATTCWHSCWKCINIWAVDSLLMRVTIIAWLWMFMTFRARECGKVICRGNRNFILVSCFVKWAAFYSVYCNDKYFMEAGLVSNFGIACPAFCLASIKEKNSAQGRTWKNIEMDWQNGTCSVCSTRDVCGHPRDETTSVSPGYRLRHVTAVTVSCCCSDCTTFVLSWCRVQVKWAENFPGCNWDIVFFQWLWFVVGGIKGKWRRKL